MRHTSYFPTPQSMPTQEGHHRATSLPGADSCGEVVDLGWVTVYMRLRGLHCQRRELLRSPERTQTNTFRPSRFQIDLVSD